MSTTQSENIELKSYIYSPPKSPSIPIAPKTLPRPKPDTLSQSNSDNNKSAVAQHTSKAFAGNVLVNRNPILKGKKPATSTQSAVSINPLSSKNGVYIGDIVKQQLEGITNYSKLMREDLQTYKQDALIEMTEGAVFSQDYLDLKESRTASVDCGENSKKVLATISGLMGGSIRCRQFNNVDQFIQNRLNNRTKEKSNNTEENQ
ncbi:hypothetical protein ACFOHL_13300 [Agaribacter flavus]|uniref:Uncharacterized protein n=2 Tax=Agaribacter flavus TaxID=1902781 RepID=A0ABV7FR63_9ALTE